MSPSGKSTSSKKTSRAARPASGRPVGSNREATLARLLPAARQHFAEKGFAQTTFKDVASSVGLTHAALYAYFANKIELYLATLADTQALLLPDYQRAIEQGTTLRERIAGILMASAAAHDRDSSVTGFLAAVPIEIRRHPELREHLLASGNEVFNALRNMFDEARQRGELQTAASDEDLISVFLGSGVGVALFQYGIQSESLTQAMQLYVSLIEGVLLR